MEPHRQTFLREHHALAVDSGDPNRTHNKEPKDINKFSVALSPVCRLHCPATSQLESLSIRKRSSRIGVLHLNASSTSSIRFLRVLAVLSSGYPVDSIASSDAISIHKHRWVTQYTGRYTQLPREFQRPKCFRRLSYFPNICKCLQIDTQSSGPPGDCGGIGAMIAWSGSHFGAKTLSQVRTDCGEGLGATLVYSMIVTHWLCTPDTLNRIKREIPFRDSKMFRSVFEVHLKANSNRFPMIQMILWGLGKGLEGTRIWGKARQPNIETN